MTHSVTYVNEAYRDDVGSSGDESDERLGSPPRLSRARAFNRPPPLNTSSSMLKSFSSSRSSSPAGPLSRRTTPLSSASSAASLFEDAEEKTLNVDTDLRPCVMRFMDGDTLAHERHVRVIRRDVMLRRRIGGETYVVARARSAEERLRCLAALTSHAHELRLSADESSTAGYAALAHDAVIVDNVDDVCSHDGTTMVYVVNDDPFDTRLYGVARATSRDADAFVARFGFMNGVVRDFGTDAVVDRLFACRASNAIDAGDGCGGAEFVRTKMIDALRPSSSSTTVAEASAAPRRVAGATCHAHVDATGGRRKDVLTYDGIMSVEDVMLEREDWVTRRFIKLYRVPTSVGATGDAGVAKSWLKMVSPAKTRGSGSDAYEDVLEEPTLVSTFHAVAKRALKEPGVEVQQNVAPASASVVARACGVVIDDDDDDIDDTFAHSIIDALSCALTTDGGAPLRDDVVFEPSADVEFQRAALDAVRGAADASSTRAPRRSSAAVVVCPRSHTTTADDVVESLRASMRAADASACVLVAKCTTSLTFDGGFSTRDILARAAESGLFTDGGIFKSTVHTACGARIIAARFHQRPFRIRASVPSDVEPLLAIEADAWKDTPDMRTPASTIVERVTNNAAMNFIVEDIDTRVVRGGMYAQFIDTVDAAGSTTWDLKETNRRLADSTRCVQLLDVFVDQAYGAACAAAASHSGASPAVSVGQELRNHVLYFAEHSNARWACAVTRTRGFRETQRKFPSKDLSYEAYVRGKTLDRGVFFHTSAGAEIVRIVSPWRVKDDENDGNGVLVRYDVEEYAFSRATTRGRHRPATMRRPSDPTVNGGEYSNTIQAIAWEARARSFPVRRTTRDDQDE